MAKFTNEIKPTISWCCKVGARDESLLLHLNDELVLRISEREGIFIACSQKLKAQGVFPLGDHNTMNVTWYNQAKPVDVIEVCQHSKEVFRLLQYAREKRLSIGGGAYDATLREATERLGGALGELP